MAIESRWGMQRKEKKVVLFTRDLTAIVGHCRRLQEFSSPTFCCVKSKKAAVPVRPFLHVSHGNDDLSRRPVAAADIPSAKKRVVSKFVGFADHQHRSPTKSGLGPMPALRGVGSAVAFIKVLAVRSFSANLPLRPRSACSSIESGTARATCVWFRCAYCTYTLEAGRLSLSAIGSLMRITAAEGVQRSAVHCIREMQCSLWYIQYIASSTVAADEQPRYQLSRAARCMDQSITWRACIATPRLETGARSC